MSEITQIFPKTFMDAFLASATAATNGMQSFNVEMLEFTKSRLEGRLAATEALLAADSFKEAMDLQTDFMKQSLESYIEESGKLGEMAAKIGSEMVEKLVKPAA
jgi:phasin family protein